jgi:sporulation protein YlmC with PRC-barrel domain
MQLGYDDLGIRRGTGDPNTVVLGSVGDIWIRTDGGAVTTLYVKESGTSTNTGWVAK